MKKIASLPEEHMNNLMLNADARYTRKLVHASSCEVVKKNIHIFNAMLKVLQNTISEYTKRTLKYICLININKQRCGVFINETAIQ